LSVRINGKWRKGSNGLAVYKKERLRTSSKQRAGIAFCSGGSLYLNSNTDVTVRNGSSSEVKQGEVAVVSPSGKSRITTSQASSTGRSFDVRASGGTSEVIAVAGKVQVKNRKGSVVVPPNEATVVHTDQAPSAPHAVDAQAATSWTAVVKPTPTPTPSPTPTATATPTTSIAGYSFSNLGFTYTSNAGTGQGTLSGYVCGDPYSSPWHMTLTFVVTDPNGNVIYNNTGPGQFVIPQTGYKQSDVGGDPNAFYLYQFKLNPPTMQLEINLADPRYTPEDQTVSVAATPLSSCPTSS
jgi:hypothetical protein